MAGKLIVLSDKETATLTDDSGSSTVPLSAIATSDSKGTLLPTDCRIHITNGLASVFVIEQQPCVRDVNWNTSKDEWKNLISRGAKSFAQVKGNETKTRFRLAFPYTIFIVRMEGICVTSIRVFFRSHTISTPTDYLQQAGLLKDDTLVVEDQKQILHHGMTQASTVNVAVEYFWHQTLGTGELIGTVHPDVPEVSSVWEWESASRKHQDWILKAQWEKTDLNLKTASQAMLQLPDAKDGEDQTFATVAARIRHSVPNKKTRDHELIESPCVSIMLGTTRLRQGDTIVSSKRQFGCKKDKQYLVLGFYERTSKGVVHARLDGVANPVPIGTSKGLVDFKLLQPEREVVSEITYNGVVFKTGTKFCVSSGEDIGLLATDIEYIIKKLEVDSEGDARVKIADLNTWFYITYDGGKLLPSIYQNIPSLKDNTFTFGKQKMSVGTFVEITGSAAKVQDTLLRVASIAQEREAYIATFEGHEEKITIYKNGERQIDWNTVTYEFSDKRVVLGNKVLDLTDCESMLITISEDSQEVGKMHKVKGLVHPTDGHRFDVNLVVDDKQIPVIKHSNWVFRIKHEQVSDRYDDGALTLQSGEVLICVDTITGLTKDEELTILCFGKNKTTKDLTDIIFSDGRAINMTQASLKLFSRKDGKPWSEKKIAKLPQGSPPTTRVQQGERCRVTTNNINGEIGTVTDKSYDDRFVKFDNPQPNGRGPTITEGWFLYKYLERLDKSKVTWCFSKNARVEKRSDGTLIQLPTELIIELTTIQRIPTKLTDLFGNSLSVGDIVVPIYQGFTKECPRRVIGIPMLVVHYSSSGSPFLFLWAGSTHKPGVLSRDCRDFNTITIAFKDRLNELYVNPPKDCEKITFIEA